MIYETNRSSLPVKRGRETAVVKAYPFHRDIVEGTKVVARPERSYERGQDLFDPQQYVSLLKQRPGAFDDALPLKKWKKSWPECYHEMLVRVTGEVGRSEEGVKECVGIARIASTLLGEGDRDGSARRR